MLTSCGGAAQPAAQPLAATLKPGVRVEEKIITTEVIPLNNCGGNSKLGVDVERSREFSYVATDKNGQELGVDYYFLTAALQKEYSFEQGEKETQTYTLHLEVEANSQVEYTIAWKELWISGYADISREADRTEVPYKVRQGLTFTIEKVKEIDCDKRPLKLFWHRDRQDNVTVASKESESAQLESDYQFVRVEGYIFSTQEEGTVPLKLYWHPDRKDNTIVATKEGEAAQLGSGYQFIRVEGYVFPTQKPGTVPLKLYWHPDRQDNVTVTVGKGEQAQLTSGYTFVRFEGYVFPAD